MKSIKEKADEYGKANLTGWGVVSAERVEGFEAGASYMLECIESIIINNEDNTLNMTRCLVDCIEKLKK